jgi:sigma-B regulation protein RsbQ
MNVLKRNAVKTQGNGDVALMFSHGFGCDQQMWRSLAPRFAERFKVITFDLVGCGQSDLSAFDTKKYASLNGYATDVIEILDALKPGPVVFVGHSVSAMIGLLASNRRPEAFAGHVMIGPSPCYLNDAAYAGGFDQEDIDSLLATLEDNYLGWAGSMAPAIMGAPDRPDLGEELAASFCRTDPAIAKQFARVTFTSDNRKDLPKLVAPALIVQSSEDFIAPPAVGEYMSQKLPHAMLRVIENAGHCPHMSAPDACARAMDEFLASLPE